MMGLLLYVAQLLLLLIFVAVFKDTSLFNAKTFAVSLVVATVVWMAAQARAHMKAKIFYIDPDSRKSEKPEKTGPSS
jgi:ATP synthase protein I